MNVLSIEHLRETLGSGVTAMTTLMQIALIGVAIMMETTGVGESFWFALFIASAYTLLHWFDKYQISELEMKREKLEFLVASKTHYIAELQQHRERVG